VKEAHSHEFMKSLITGTQEVSPTFPSSVARVEAPGDLLKACVGGDLVDEVPAEPVYGDHLQLLPLAMEYQIGLLTGILLFKATFFQVIDDHLKVEIELPQSYVAVYVRSFSSEVVNIHFERVFLDQGVPRFERKGFIGHYGRQMFQTGRLIDKALCYECPEMGEALLRRKGPVTSAEALTQPCEPLQKEIGWGCFELGSEEKKGLGKKAHDQREIGGDQVELIEGASGGGEIIEAAEELPRAVNKGLIFGKSFSRIEFKAEGEVGVHLSYEAPLVPPVEIGPGKDRQELD